MSVRKLVSGLIAAVIAVTGLAVFTSTSSNSFRAQKAAAASCSVQKVVWGTAGARVSPNRTSKIVFTKNYGQYVNWSYASAKSGGEWYLGVNNPGVPGPNGFGWMPGDAL